ncbi:capsular polysaccharide export protein, LipB/KpsS family [Sinorhizobium meliloti]|uniref:capsular polysaccharide export protein, LipB/KpsS family n=1 Tax=Rhizobium meliloti TaxID=382 RepID=UPI00299D8C8C
MNTETKHQAFSHTLAAAVPFKQPVLPSDITMVICVRAHEANPWVLDRIKLLGAYYDPLPEILIVDFGSQPEFAGQIEGICEANDFRYHHVADYDTYSPAAAHNRGFELVETQFVFFCDTDFFSFREVFADLARAATDLQMRDIVDVVINFPAYHLNERDTDAFLSSPSEAERSAELKRIAYRANFVKFSKDENFFVAPYSNVYLINRQMYAMTGGYDERFRGHGSEDFEYLIRLAIHTGHLPVPDHLRNDAYGPMKGDFFSHKPYRGFRRLLELASQPAANLGFKTFHLWHPREKSVDWYANNDWKRSRFNEALDGYIEGHHKLLSVDFLQREKTIACLCKHHDQWGYFTPLRAAGYKTVAFFDDGAETTAAVSGGLISGEFDGIAIFNPYMKSHSRFYETVLLARQKGKKVIVIERGALPATIYYDEDVSYAAPGYSEEAFLAEDFTPDEITSSVAYVTKLRAGNETLEAMDSYEATKERRLALSELEGPICFIPLQLEDDMAVTMFVKGEQSYPDFLHGLPALIDANPGVTFIVKPHPLSKIDVLTPKRNLILAERKDNIHYLLDAADVTLCYNSGVGLLSVLHQKPTITLGNAFYNVAGAGYRADSAQEGLAAYLAGNVEPPTSELITRLAAWFLHKKYSQFTATDNVREFATRKAHGYKDILVTSLRLDGVTYALDRIKRHAPFSWSSHGAASISAQPAERNGKVEISAAKLEAWARKDFHRRNYAKAAELFERAFTFNQDRPNLLRYAAEAHWRSGEKRMARAVLVKAIKLLPGNKRARLRLLTMKIPPLAYLIGFFEMKVPE